MEALLAPPLRFEARAQYPHQLSGGQQQRVALARAFVTGPELVFADEPTGNLDPETGERIIQTLFELNRSEGTTLVLVTHDHALARRCDRCLRLADGQLTEVTSKLPAEAPDAQREASA